MYTSSSAALPACRYFDTSSPQSVGGRVELGFEPSTANMKIVSIWVPIVDATEEAGGLVLIPESHHWGLQPSQRDQLKNMRSDDDPEQRAPAVSVETRVGDCVLFSNLTYHGSSFNRTDGVRWSLDWRVHASPKSARIMMRGTQEQRTTDWWATRAWWSHPGTGEAGIAAPWAAWAMPVPRL
jgi:hypothetical protein